ncbi:DEAD/DEAH box helicase family protein, partial [Turicibacter sanguinis]
MKLHFDSSLDYQNKAIDSVVKLFKGQRVKQANFSVLYPEFIGREQIKTGFGNKLDLDQQQILKNLKQIQLENKLPQSEKLNGMNFTIEMETGTGKTYVYLKTIYELNQVYGFTKFVIVVPSVAIREGVNKTLEITKEHFSDLFDGVPVEAFVYDSSNLEQVRNFAASSHIQIMVINIDAFRKSFDDPTKENKANIIHRDTDKLEGQKPIDLIRETNPIVIIDEPQSVDTTKKSKEAIASLNPLCTLRYSATHVDKHHMIYRLDAIDAYEQKLVKQIEVLSVRSEDSFNLPYIKLIETKERQAVLELDVEKKGVVKREQKKVKLNDSLYDISGNRELYQHYQVEDISWEAGNQYVIIRGQRIDKGQAIGDIDDDLVKRFQIRQTIEEHLKKEMRLNPKGIKVLSLFFIDRVAHYRDYDLDGNILQGKYAKMFEEEYEKLIKEDRFKENQNRHFDLDMIHNGYFSQDKKGILKDTKGNTQADEDVYNLIMKDKERLLDMKTPLR